MAFFFLFLLIIPYVMVGAKFAQAHYTELMRDHQQVVFSLADKQKDFPKTLVEFVKNNSVIHNTYCNLNYTYLKKKGCDCPNGQDAFYEAREKIAAPAAPSIPFRTIVAWPVAAVGNYITAPARRLPNYSTIDNLEIEAGIK